MPPSGNFNYLNGTLMWRSAPDESPARQAELCIQHLGTQADNAADATEAIRNAIPTVEAEPEADPIRYCETCNIEMAHTETYVYRCSGYESPRYFCKSCYDARFTSCTHCHIPIDKTSDNTYTHENEYGDTEYYCDRCYECVFMSCQECNTTVVGSTLRQSLYGDWYCRACFDRLCGTCSQCGAIIFLNRAHWVAEEPLCGNCVANMDEWDIGKF